MFISIFIVSGAGLARDLDDDSTVTLDAYGFEMSYIYTDIYILEDGSIDIYYEMEFNCLSGYQPIDVIDVGFPNDHYQLSSVTAKLNGTEIDSSRIKKSEYVEIAAEIWLTDVGYIYPGESAVFEVYCHNPAMVYPDSEDGFASCVFVQTWFGGVSGVYTSGNTAKRVRYHFPDALTDINEAVVRETTSSYVNAELSDASINVPGLYIEFNDIGNPYDGYMSAVALPEEYVKVHSVFWSLTVYNNRSVIIFFAIVLALIIFYILRKRRKSKEYLPPIVTTLGGGVKKDLTPSQVAILMQRPLTQVATLILFEMMKLGYLEIRTTKPALRFDVSVSTTVINQLQKYQQQMIAGIKKRNKEDIKWAKGASSGTIPREPVHQTDLKKALITRIKGVSKKMKGYSVRRTRKHYEEIIDRAWEEMKKTSPELKDAFLWIMVDDNYEERLDRRGGSYYYPHWYVRNYYFYTGRTYSSRPSRSFFRIQSHAGSTHVAPINSLSSGIISKPQTFTKDLQRVTRPAPTRSSGGRSGGGGGGGCACACACACAGGGR